MGLKPDPDASGNTIYGDGPARCRLDSIITSELDVDAALGTPSEWYIFGASVRLRKPRAGHVMPLWEVHSECATRLMK